MTAAALAYQDLRQIRKSKKMSLKELGEQTGLSPSFISQVERGKCNMSLISMVRVSKALGVDPHELFPDEEQKIHPLGSGEESKRKEDVEQGYGKKEYRIVSGDFPERAFDVVHVTAAPHSATEMTCHEGEEFIWIIEGCMHHLLNGETRVLQAGDSIHFPSSIPHSYQNRQDIELKYLIVVTEKVK